MYTKEDVLNISIATLKEIKEKVFEKHSKSIHTLAEEKKEIIFLVSMLKENINKENLKMLKEYYDDESLIDTYDEMGGDDAREQDYLDAFPRYWVIYKDNNIKKSDLSDEEITPDFIDGFESAINDAEQEGYEILSFKTQEEMYAWRKNYVNRHVKKSV